MKITKSNKEDGKKWIKDNKLIKDMVKRDVKDVGNLFCVWWNVDAKLKNINEGI